ncbi:alpha/beta fold hydrolase [Aquabacterium sp.]|uniref:alpha/beta fold hydrolase n=1 Tax=Aquabacterium sp. TaxID=1872578 RepID=UPI002C51CE41|nr:alpha/beta hydrolase [Aquabacterium sp.]HSW03585.1 alpha/beta hydrolase [Aquabacterium sp.]
MLKFTSATTTDGVRLNVVETGNPQGPAIVFVHGISQSWLSWIALLADAGLRAKYRLIAFDLRGHGASQGSQVAVDGEGRPFAALPDAAYNDGHAGRTAALWAGDLLAVISGLGLSSPTVVGWSYGGAVLLDTIGIQAGLGAIGKAVVLASSPVLLPPGTADGGADTVFSGATFGALVATTPVNPFTGQANAHGGIAAGLSDFVELCYQDELGRAAPAAARVQASIGFNLFTPAAVRQAIIGRAFDYRATLQALSAAEKARMRVIVPLGDKVLQPANTRAYWAATGLTVDTIAGEGHLYHDRNAADFARQLALFAG